MAIIFITILMVQPSMKRKKTQQINSISPTPNTLVTPTPTMLSPTPTMPHVTPTPTMPHVTPTLIMTHVTPTPTINAFGSVRSAGSQRLNVGTRSSSSSTKAYFDTNIYTIRTYHFIIITQYTNQKHGW